MALTWARVAMVPVVVVLFHVPVPWGRGAAAAVFALAAATDWLDGYLARRLDQTSPFGAFLDPVADKLMVIVALLLLVEATPEGGAWAWVVNLCAMVIIARELLVSALREWMASLGAREEVAVSSAGKWKTATQMMAITLLLYGQQLGSVPTRTFGALALVVAAVLAYVSATSYALAARKALLRPGSSPADSSTPP